MACTTTKFNGRDCMLEYAFGCGDALPQAGDWKRVASMRTKSLTLTWDTADDTTDDIVGFMRSNIATFQTASISGDGLAKASGTGSANLIALIKHVANPDGGQPVAWVRLTYPDLTFTFFAIVTNASREAPYDDRVTFSFEATATSSDFGLIVADTPSGPPVAPAGVNVYPATASLQVGKSANLAAIVTPFGAPGGVVWSTSDATKATVTQSGVVKAIAAGTATITAKSAADNSKSGTATITVTA